VTPLWAAVRGQDAALGLLRRAVQADRVAHAYAFVGPSGVGRRLTALGLAQACLCPERGCGHCPTCRRVAAGQHPDCHLLVPTPPATNPKGTPSLRIEQVRELEHWASLAPLAAPRKVFIMDDAERMTLPTAQALLKTLEEPPPRTHLVLILANVRVLPPTVLSRCQIVRFRPLPEADAVSVLVERGMEPEGARLLARLCRGQVGRALAGEPGAVRARRDAALELSRTPRVRLAARLPERPDRETVAAYLETYWVWLRDALCLAAGGDPALLVNADLQEELAALARRPLPALAAAIAVVREARQALDVNVSPRLALERALLVLAPAA
jgi:DNA polymerase-3 subunit delta'